jgi:hypothetical protein
VKAVFVLALDDMTAYIFAGSFVEFFIEKRMANLSQSSRATGEER